MRRMSTGTPWRRSLVLFSALLLAGASSTFAQDVTRMDAVVQSFVTNQTFAGSVLVTRGSNVIFNKGYGLADIEGKVSNRPATRFPVASITKQFTAAAILLLAERGRLNIDDPVKKHLPEAPPHWDGMTVFHLLSHTAGFQGLQTPVPARVAITSPDGSLEGFVAQAMKQPLESAPGAAFNYSNAGYYILGHLIQKLSGQTYEQFIQANILTPLGMKETEVPRATSTRARMYNPGPNGLVAFVQPAGVVPSAGGFQSTTADLARWQTALYGGKVVSAASLKRMTTPFKGDYGLGIYIRTVDGRLAYTHGGGAPPFANLTYFPDSATSVAVLGNINAGRAPEIAAFLGALAHGQAVTLPSERKAITLAASVLKPYVGDYEMAGQAIAVTLDGAQLALQFPGGPSMPILAESANSFYLKDLNYRIEFIRDGSGAVTEFIIHQGTRQDRARRTK